MTIFFDSRLLFASHLMLRHFHAKIFFCPWPRSRNMSNFRFSKWVNFIFSSKFFIENEFLCKKYFKRNVKKYSMWWNVIVFVRFVVVVMIIILQNCITRFNTSWNSHKNAAIKCIFNYMLPHQYVIEKFRLS